jgi:hypothetical protein
MMHSEKITQRKRQLKLQEESIMTRIKHKGIAEENAKVLLKRNSRQFKIIHVACGDLRRSQVIF